VAHLLLVDDDPVQLAARQAVLKSAGFTISVATSAPNALGLLRASAESARVDGVITDHIMPGVSGEVFVRELRKVSPNIPVLVITGAPEVEGEYAGLGVMFRNKPLPPPELIHAVTELITK